ncbi:MAG: hypothetical protein AUJ98_11770 [Bacteroidetes bacterium CG2_30_33_31]|nr:MAG: hypothetical protein AUJ98_11770 [Bacteroidetes bacterium CG2_30_33_31]
MSKNSKTNSAEVKMIFEKKNYILMIVGVAFILLGLVLLGGGGSQNPEVFNPEIFNSQRIVIAPTLMLIGFVIEIYAIMWKSKK